MTEMGIILMMFVVCQVLQTASMMVIARAVIKAETDSNKYSS